MTLHMEGSRYLKPSSCEGCPFYSMGKYYTPDTVVEGSEVFFLAQNPGEDEEAGRRLVKTVYQAYGKPDEVYEMTTPQPLLGKTGRLFTDRFLPLTGLTRPQVSLGNAIRCRPGRALNMQANDLPPLSKTMKLETSKADIVKALRHCTEAHLKVPNSTKLIVTMGRYAMFALTGIQKEDTEYGQKTGVMESWRGYGVDVASFDHFSTADTTTYHPLHSDKRILFTMHLAALFRGERNKRFFPAVLLDFTKVKRLLEGTWPAAVPTWTATPPTTWPKYSCFDTEYIPDSNTLIRWSLCDNQYNLYCVEADDTPGGHIPIHQGSVVLAQNWLADISHFRRMADITQVRLEDLMLADSVLYTGEPHSLNYIQSKFGSLNRHKHLSGDDPQFYSALDAHQPLYMWMNHYIPQFKQDPLSWRIYKQYTLPLLHIIEKSQQYGSPVYTERLLETQQILQRRIEAYQAEAQELTGDPTFNLGGQKRMLEVMYD